MLRAVSDEQLQGIADAIKIKSGDDTPMSVAVMALRIGLIEGGGAPIPEGLGLSKLWIGSWTCDKDNVNPLIPHQLGDVPKLALFYARGDWAAMAEPTFPPMTTVGGIVINPSQTTSARYRSSAKIGLNANGSTTLYKFDSYNGYIGLSIGGISFNSSSALFFRAGTEYIIFCAS